MIFRKEYIKQKLTSKLPGLDAQLKMAPTFRQEEIEAMSKFADKAKLSAVMILIIEEGGESKVVLIKRAEYDGVHSGQISFPGGRYEHFDSDFEDTATRETFEEIGVKAVEYEVLGQLTDLFIPPSNFLVKVFVGYCPVLPVFNIDSNEVQRVVKVKISDFYSTNNLAEKLFIASTSGQKKSAPYFHVEGEQIWGATAMILSELIETLR